MSVRTSTVTSLLILFNTTQHNTLWLFTLLSCSTVSVLELNVLCLVRIGEAMTVWNTLNVQIHGGKMGRGGGAVWKVSIKILTDILFSFFRYISESPSGSMVTDVNPMLLELSSSAKKKKNPTDFSESPFEIFMLRVFHTQQTDLQQGTPALPVWPPAEYRGHSDHCRTAATLMLHTHIMADFKGEDTAACAPASPLWQVCKSRVLWKRVSNSNVTARISESISFACVECRSLTNPFISESVHVWVCVYLSGITHSFQTCLSSTLLCVRVCVCVYVCVLRSVKSH